jgi:hypothetical protein
MENAKCGKAADIPARELFKALSDQRKVSVKVPEQRGINFER